MKHSSGTLIVRSRDHRPNSDDKESRTETPSAELDITYIVRKRV